MLIEILFIAVSLLVALILALFHIARLYHALEERQTECNALRARNRLLMEAMNAVDQPIAQALVLNGHTYQPAHLHPNGRGHLWLTWDQ